MIANKFLAFKKNECWKFQHIHIYYVYICQVGGAKILFTIATKCSCAMMTDLILGRGGIHKSCHPFRRDGGMLKDDVTIYINLFSIMGDKKGEGGVKNLKKWMTVIYKCSINHHT